MHSFAHRFLTASHSYLKVTRPPKGFMQRLDYSAAAQTELKMFAAESVSLRKGGVSLAEKQTSVMRFSSIRCEPEAIVATETPAVESI